MQENSLKSYLEILEVRCRGAQRNMYLTGMILILSLLAFFALGILGRLEGVELFLISPMLISFTLGFISFLLKYEINKALIAFGIELTQDGTAS